MLWLADENLALAIVEWLRHLGHDVLYAAEVARTREDADLLDLAEAERRYVITDDKDFGDLVFHQNLNSHGILLIRIRAQTVAQRLERLKAQWQEIVASIPGHFVVVTANRVRVRPIRP